MHRHKLPRRTAQPVTPAHNNRKQPVTTGFSQARSCHTRR